jgi:hypothetical protein
MKHYQKVLLILTESGTPSAKQNKFAKIASETNDEILKDLAKKVAQMYSWHLKSGYTRQLAPDDPRRAYMPTNWIEWSKYQKVVNKEISNYAEQRLFDAKPEWMVMAEKHGWTPPRN